MLSDKRLLAISLFIVGILILIFSAFQAELKSLYLTRFLGSSLIVAATTVSSFARKGLNYITPGSIPTIRISLAVLMVLSWCLGAYVQEPKSSQFAYGLGWLFMVASAGLEVFDKRGNKEQQSQS
jgi:hypothetical protein